MSTERKLRRLARCADQVAANDRDWFLRNGSRRHYVRVGWPCERKEWRAVHGRPPRGVLHIAVAKVTAELRARAFFEGTSVLGEDIGESEARALFAEATNGGCPLEDVAEAAATFPGDARPGPSQQALTSRRLSQPGKRPRRT
jgi:hypothetical protein